MSDGLVPQAEGEEWFRILESDGKTILQGFVPPTDETVQFASIFWTGLLSPAGVERFVRDLAEMDVWTIDVDWWSDQEDDPVTFAMHSLPFIVDQLNYKFNRFRDGEATLAIRARSYDNSELAYVWGTVGFDTTSIINNFEVGIRIHPDRLNLVADTAMNLMAKTSRGVVSSRYGAEMIAQLNAVFTKRGRDRGRREGNA